MAQTKSILVKDLTLDLENFRTVKQSTELDAVKAMISISPDRFWALMESILDTGYLLTENIIAIKDTTGKVTVVKEGNRRIGAMKIIYGLITSTHLGLPAALQARITLVDEAWKRNNKKVPCTVFEHSDKAIVEKIVTMIHGKGDKASRDPWSSIAKARHNRDVNKANEPGLDLIEKYLKEGKNLTGMQMDRFAGDYPLSVLDTAIQKTAPRIGAVNGADIAAKYPTIAHREGLEDMMLAIGLKQLGFEGLRSSTTDYGATFKFPPLTPPTPPPTPTPAPAAPPTPTPTPTPTSTPATPPPTPPATPVTPAAPTVPPPTPAAPVNTPTSVNNKLKLFRPLGVNRDKVVTLRDEILNLNIGKTPIAFCFLLRSMFEISGKAYFTDHSLSTSKPSGKDKTLLDILTEAKNHIIAANPGMVRPLHGAITELSRSAGLLSVTSMNQLVHNASFSVVAADVCSLFNNIYPLLEALNS
jgi:hypothetical protein